MKKYILRLKYLLKEKKRKFSYLIGKKENIQDLLNIPKAYIFLAADYRNMGDVAITYAQRNMLENLLPNYEIIEVPYDKTFEKIYEIKKLIKKEDIITIVGGGNMSDRYDAIEEARRMVIKNFKNNKILSFPQTIEFSDSIEGNEALRRSKIIYSKNKNLVILAREKMSFEKMKKIYDKNEVFLAPDIVFSLKKFVEDNLIVEEKDAEKDIGICMRNDSEKNVDVNIDFSSELENEYKSRIEFFDTYIDENDFNYEKRYEILLELIRKIKRKRIIITDRLHGMILSYIADVPCIAFDNSNHKVKSTYNTWLNRCENIYLYEKKDINLCEIIEKMISQNYKNNIELNFEKLMSELK